MHRVHFVLIVLNISAYTDFHKPEMMMMMMTMHIGMCLLGCILEENEPRLDSFAKQWK